MGTSSLSWTKETTEDRWHLPVSKDKRLVLVRRRKGVYTIELWVQGGCTCEMHVAADTDFAMYLAETSFLTDLEMLALLARENKGPKRPRKNPNYLTWVERKGVSLWVGALDPGKQVLYSITAPGSMSGLVLLYCGGHWIPSDSGEPHSSVEEAKIAAEKHLAETQPLLLLAHTKKMNMIKSNPRKKAKRNPYGLRAKGNMRIIRVGKGEHTHILNPKTSLHLCCSGKNAGKKGGSGAKPTLYESKAKFVTCYRCIKLAQANQSRGLNPDGSK